MVETGEGLVKELVDIPHMDMHSSVGTDRGSRRGLGRGGQKKKIGITVIEQQ